MPRSTLSRLTTAISAVLFGFNVLAHPGAMPAAGGAAAHSGMTHVMAEMPAGTVHHSDSSPHHAPVNCEQHDCCCYLPVGVAVPVASTLSWVPAAIAARPEYPRVERAHVAAAEHVLPFANAPPGVFAI